MSDAAVVQGHGAASVRWLRAWAAERFPAKNAVFFVLLYAMVLVVGRAAGAPGAVDLSWRDVPGLVAFWSFFLVLRVLDEHKDFAADAVAHPNRVLQRGLVTLGQLRVVGAVAIAVQAGVSLWLDGGRFGLVTIAWAVAFGYALLMAREFFAREWLRPRLVLYALSHMLVMPLLVAWVLAMSFVHPAVAGEAVTVATNALPAVLMPALLAAMVFFGGLAFEVARKVRAPADEHPSADTYTRSLGIPGAMRLLSVVVALGLGFTLVLVAANGLSGVGLAIAAVVLAAGAMASRVAAAVFTRSPTREAAKRVEAAAGVALLVAHVVVLVATLVTRGVAWR